MRQVLGAMAGAGGVAVVAGALVACGGTDEPLAPAGPAFPLPEWQHGAPEAFGLDPTRLEEAAAWASDRASYCLAVARDGVLVGEWYGEGFGPETRAGVFSVTKTLAALLVGISVDRGELSLDTPASRHIPAWRGTASEGVTVGDLLAMASGRYWDFGTDYVQMALNAKDKTAFAVALSQQHPPGTRWEYNNSAVQTLEAVLEDATGRDVVELARERLFEPLGAGASLSRDEAGNAVLYSDAQCSCRDLLRVGLLLARGGRWGARALVTEEWVRGMTEPSTRLNAAYGRLLWLNRDGHHVLPSAPQRQEGDTRLVPDAPPTLYSGLGLGGQLMTVDPDTGLVVARIGPARLVGDPIGLDVWNGIVPRVRAAVVR